MTITATERCIAPHAHDPDRPRRAVDGGYICAGHVRQLEQLIAEMPAAAADLDRPPRPAPAPRVFGGSIRPAGT